MSADATLQAAVVEELAWRQSQCHQWEQLLREAHDPDVCEQLQLQIDAARTEVDPLVWAVVVAGWDIGGLLQLPLVVETPPASDADRAEQLFQWLLQQPHRADAVH